jgi:hypothetical protein
MKYTSEIQPVSSNPEQLEDLYQKSRQAGVEAEFRSELNTLYAQAPDNLLLAAWYYRFLRSPLAKAARHIPWMLAILLGTCAGLAIGAIADPDLLIHDSVPAFVLLWAPIASIFCLVYLAIASRKNAWNYILPGLILACATAYVLLVSRGQAQWAAETYLIQMAIHLPLLCWICLGLAVTGWRTSPYNRFAFLTKSIEVGVAAGLFLIFGVFLGVITTILFTTLDVNIPETILRLLAFCGIGLISILSVATLYDPTVPPEAQDFSQGLSKFIVMLMRLLLPVTLLILVVYILFIPFNFMAPFRERDILIIFNIVLFALVGLLIGATPLHTGDLSTRLQRYLRSGIIALAGLAVLVSLYALSAVVFRSSDGLTMNRLTVIGWNTINLSIFLSIVILQLRGGMQGWANRLHLVFNRATALYALWCVFVILVIPLIYR